MPVITGTGFSVFFAHPCAVLFRAPLVKRFALALLMTPRSAFVTTDKFAISHFSALLRIGIARYEVFRVGDGCRRGSRRCLAG